MRLRAGSEPGVDHQQAGGVGHRGRGQGGGGFAAVLAAAPARRTGAIAGAGHLGAGAGAADLGGRAVVVQGALVTPCEEGGEGEQAGGEGVAQHPCRVAQGDPGLICPFDEA